MKVEIGKSIEVQIIAREKWNSTHIEISEGEEYEFVATGNWRDLFKKSDADGYTNAYMQRFDSRKRAQEYNWFALMGSLDQSTYFFIGKNKTITFEKNGELYCFANDANGFYWNNSGKITLTVKRMK